MMKKVWFVFLFLFSVGVNAQNFPKKMVDSLIAVALSHKCNHPVKLDRDSVLKRMFQISNSTERIAMFYDIVGNYGVLSSEKALYYHKLILKEAQKRADKLLEAAVMAELGFIICINGNTAEGLKMIYASLEKAEATGNAQVIGIAYNNLGNCYPNNKKLSCEYMQKALEFARKGNDYLFACFDLLNLGKLSLSQNHRDSAMAYYLEAFCLGVSKNIESSIPKSLLALSQFDDEANLLQYCKRAALMPFAIRSREMEVLIASRIAEFYIKQNKMDSAFVYVSIVNSKTQKAPLTIQLNALNLVRTYYETIHQSDSALFYLSKYYTLKDSLYGTKVMAEAQSMAYNDMQRQKELEAQKAAFQNRIILFFISSFALMLMGLTFVFWRSKRKEQEAKNQLSQTLDQLRSTQTQLIQSEKMASLGELTAGIAHEIQNPLNFVNNFSEVNKELLEELKAERLKPNAEREEALENELINDVISNEEKINHHGKRADAIVKGMLQHSRSSSGVKEPTDINALADEYLRLAYHGLRAKDKSFNVSMITDYDASIGLVDVIPQDIGRVVLNLITNAFYAVDERKNQSGDGFEPTVTVRTRKTGNTIEFSVQDNGNGIPQKIKDKIFQPFFTTKPTGQGTGLGLSLSYDIVKAHGGELKVETQENMGTTFYLLLYT